MKFNSLIRFFNNLRYLCRYNLKDFYTICKNIDNLIQRTKYEIKSEWDDIIVPRVKDNWLTVKELVETQKSIIRIGDGEFTLMEGRDIPFQSYDKKLVVTLKEILKEKNENLLVGLVWEYYHKIKELRDFPKQAMYTSLPNLYNTISKNIVPDKIYYSAAISQIYAMYKIYDFEKHFCEMKKIWDNQSITVITGDRVFNNINYNIFDNAATVDYIYGPTMHAYNEFESLKDKIKKTNKDNILIFALGPCGKALAYEMFKLGYRVLDIGHSIKDYNEYKSDTLMNYKNIVKFYKPD